MRDDTTPEAEAGPSSAPLEDFKSPELDQREAYIRSVFETFDASSFNWNAYEGTYKGRALITRLMHISTLIRLPPPADSPNPPASLVQIIRESLKRAISHIQSSTWDVATYTLAIARLDALDTIEGKAGGMEVEKSETTSEWAENARENEKKEMAKLDVELRGYMSNLIKESIRLTYLAFAELGFKAGSWQTAMKNYQAAREYSTSPQHHLDLQTAIVHTCLVFNKTSFVAGHVTKLEGSLDRLHPLPASGPTKNQADLASMTASDIRDNREREAKGSAARQKIMMQIRTARGLLALCSQKFEEAGRQFAEMCEEGGLKDLEGVTISTADVALICALCVLATGDRSRIQRILLDRATFRSSLDDTQGWILDLVHAFMAGEYSQASQILGNVEPMLLLNPFLAAHISDLRRALDAKSIVQYVEPFLSVRFHTMANSFGVDEDSMLAQVESLICDGKIRGKIDLIDRILVLKEGDPRARLIDHALKVGRDSTATSHAALVRMRMREADIMVDPKPKKNEFEEEAAPPNTGQKKSTGSGFMGSLRNRSQE